MNILSKLDSFLFRNLSQQLVTSLVKVQVANITHKERKNYQVLSDVWRNVACCLREVEVDFRHVFESKNPEEYTVAHAFVQRWPNHLASQKKSCDVARRQ